MMITAIQLRAGDALWVIDQKTLVRLAGVSLPTIRRMEASGGNVRGIIDTLSKVVDALNHAGIELIGDICAATAVDAACGLHSLAPRQGALADHTRLQRLGNPPCEFGDKCGSRMFMM